MDARLPAHLEVSALRRQVEAAGGFATVLHKGERDAGTILVVCAHSDSPRALFERLPDPAGERRWHPVVIENIEQNKEFDNYLERRRAQDPDLWIIELDIAYGERFIGLTSL